MSLYGKFTLLLLVCVTAAFAKTASETEKLNHFFDLVYKTTLQECPEFSTFYGKEGQDHLWTDHSLEAELKRHKQGIKMIRLFRSIDSTQLAETDLLNYKVMKWSLQDNKSAEHYKSNYLLLDQMHGFHLEFAQVLDIMPTDSPKKLENICARLEGIPSVVEHHVRLLMQGVQEGVTTPQIALKSVPEQILSQIPDDPRESPFFAPFESASSNMQKKALKILVKKVYPCFKKLHRFVVKEYIPHARETIGVRDLPDGKKWYRHIVRHHTTTDMTPKAIHELGKAEVARIKIEMQAILDELQFKGSLVEFFQFLRSDPQFFFKNEEDLLNHYRTLLTQVQGKLPNLFGTLPKMPYEVIPVPEHMAKVAPAAYYMPGSTDKSRPGKFFANTHPLDARPKWEMESLALHEALPGHHLQLSLVDEQPNLPHFRKMLHFTGYIEGWGLYSEGLGKDLGLYQDPYSHFGKLACEIFRACRLVVDTGIHAGGWTRDQAIHYFVNNTGLCLHDIEAEVDRYIVYPGQALAYKIGQLKISEIRKQAETKLGERFDIRAFHDKVLDGGALPLNLFEERMTAWIDQQAA